MTRAELLKFHEKVCAEACGLMEKKNQDYGADEDPFRNFHEWGLIGILVRLSDKMARLRTFVERGTYAVITETVRDTAIDAINYCILFLAYLATNHPLPTKENVV